MKAILCMLYDWFDRIWSPWIETPDQVLVRAIDLFASACKYCTAYRALVLGFGLGVAAFRPLIGLAAIALVAFLVLLERVACDLGNH